MRIRRGLTSRSLPCGCVAGVYETYSDEVVTVVDVRAAACDDPAHSAGTILRDPASPFQPRDHTGRPTHG
jgi:hypothetical protein